MGDGTNRYEEAIVRNADFFLSLQDDRGFIDILADEYYGVPGDASLIGHAMSVRTYAWVLTGDDKYLDSARASARLLADRQDPRGGWHHDAGYSLDAAQCVMEGFCTYERLSGDPTFRDNFVRAADRMIEGTVEPDGTPLIGNLSECGEYAHFAFMAWKQTGLERYLIGGHAILKNILDNFDAAEGYWNTAVAPEMGRVASVLQPCLNPLLRAAVARSNMKGKTIAQISEHMLPLVMKGRGPQYSLGMMAAESLLDTLDGSLELPALRQQTARAIDWVEQHCGGPVPGSLVESKKVPKGEEVYPLGAINDTVNASLWPAAAYLLALDAMNDLPTYRARAQTVAEWILSMQDEDGGFFTHEDAAGRKFGQKYGNINFYASMALWHHNAIAVRGREPWRQ
jgi:hypothetical protein